MTHILPTDQKYDDTQLTSVGGEPSRNPTKSWTTPPGPASGCDLLPTDQKITDTQLSSVGGGHSQYSHSQTKGQIMQDITILPTDHRSDDTQLGGVGGEPSRNPTKGCTTPIDGASGCDLPTTPPTAKSFTTPKEGAPSVGWLELRVWAEMHHDAQLQRIATVNRAERGGVDPALYLAYINAAETAENVARLGMLRCYRRIAPPEIRAWEKANKGIGEHLIARLLGHLGHPAEATPHHWEGTGANRTLVADATYRRTVSQLWQYCGHGDATRRIHKGISADELAALGSPQTKMLVHLLAEACMKQGSGVGNRYRDIYEHRRIITAERVHATACVRCGPGGKPAEAGSAWSKGHQNADALRVVGKELLRDLWKVSQ